MVEMNCWLIGEYIGLQKQATLLCAGNSGTHSLIPLYSPLTGLHHAHLDFILPAIITIMLTSVSRIINFIVHSKPSALSLGRCELVNTVIVMMVSSNIVQQSQYLL